MSANHRCNSGALVATTKNGSPIAAVNSAIAPTNGISCPDCNVYVTWNFSKNQDTAKEFLKYYFDNYPETFKQSQLYNQPMYGDRYKEQLFASDPKYNVLQTYRGDVLGLSGYPGPPNYPANQVQVNFTLKPQGVLYACEYCF